MLLFRRDKNVLQEMYEIIFVRVFLCFHFHFRFAHTRRGYFVTVYLLVLLVKVGLCEPRGAAVSSPKTDSQTSTAHSGRTISVFHSPVGSDYLSRKSRLVEWVL